MLAIKNGYYLIRIVKGEEWKTAFRIEKRLFEYTIMPFGLMNAPASFQEMMDEIFERDNEYGMLWYNDDMLIHGGNTEEEHQKLVEYILQKCPDHGLAINFREIRNSAKRGEFSRPRYRWPKH